VSPRPRSFLVACVLLWLICPLFPTAGAPASKTVSVKIGYFNLSLVKASHPSGQQSGKAENQFCRNSKVGNKKPVEDSRTLPGAEVNVRSGEIDASQNPQNLNQQIAAAVMSVAQEHGIDVACDVGAVFRGGDLFMDNGVDLTDELLLKFDSTRTNSGVNLRPLPRTSEKRSAMQVNFGYFSLAELKSRKEVVDADTYETQCITNIRNDVESGNKRLQAMQDSKAPKSEIDKAAEELQTKINAEQQEELEARLHQSWEAQKIAIAIERTAKKENLRIVLDQGGIYAGRDKVVSSGIDITEEVSRLMDSPEFGQLPFKPAYPR
jgi:Skp family chaperone for outer membrane proteins